MQLYMRSKSNSGRMPVIIPEGGRISIWGNNLFVRGRLGICKLKIPEFLDLCLKNSSLYICPNRALKVSEIMLWGTYRALVSCSVIGVMFGYRHQLDLFGLGYKVSVVDGLAVFRVGTSHEISYDIPMSCVVKSITGTRLVVKSVDVAQAGSVAASLYTLRKPDAYKGKGIRWDVKPLVLKEGKKQK